MKGWLLDTNVISELSSLRTDVNVAKWVESQSESRLYLSILSFGEYRKGIENLSAGDKRRPYLLRSVAALEQRFAGRILPVSDAVVLRWGAISGMVKRATGNSPSVIDTLLAATALEHNLYLVTRNVAHVKESGAMVFNPWKDNPEDFVL